MTHSKTRVAWAGMRIAVIILTALLLSAGRDSEFAQEPACKDGKLLPGSKVQKGVVCAPDFSEPGRVDTSPTSSTDNSSLAKGNPKPPHKGLSPTDIASQSKTSSPGLTILPSDTSSRQSIPPHKPAEWNLQAKPSRLIWVFGMVASGALLGLLFGCESIVILSNTLLAYRPMSDRPRFRLPWHRESVDHGVVGVSVSSALGRRLITMEEYSQIRDQYLPESELCFGLIVPILLLIFAWAATSRSSLGGSSLLTIPAVSTAVLVIGGIDRRHKFQSEVRQFIAGRARKEEAKGRLARRRNKTAKASNDNQVADGTPEA